MTRRTIGGAAAAIAAMLCALAGRAAAQAPPAPADPGARLTGAWRLNRDLSTPSSQIPEQQPADSPRGGSGGSGGGGGYGGGGGRRGGAGGGMGGIGGGMGRGGSAGGPSSTQQQQVEARLILRALTDPPGAVTIIIKDGVVDLTDSGGGIEKYQIDGAKHEVEISATKVDATVSWNTNILKAVYQKGDSTITRTWQTTDDGTQLVETVIAEIKSGAARGTVAPARPVKFVFDRE